MSFVNLSKLSCFLIICKYKRSFNKKVKALTDSSPVSPKIVSDKINIYPTMVKESVPISGVEGKSILEMIDLKGKVVITQSMEGNALSSLSGAFKPEYIGYVDQLPKFIGKCKILIPKWLLNQKFVLITDDP